MSRNALSEITSLNSNNSSYPETKNPSLHNIYTIERKKSEDTVLKNTSSVGSKSKSKSKQKINSLEKVKRKFQGKENTQHFKKNVNTLTAKNEKLTQK